MNRRSLRYVGLFAFIFLLDRISKWYVFNFLETAYKVNEYLSFTKTINRGISWGLFHDAPLAGFYIITAFIALLCAFLAFYSLIQFLNNRSIVGEILILAGGCSNLIDRIFHQGVIDFVLLSWGTYNWPVFNIADAAIVLGAGIMIIQSVGEKS